jgi:predicted nicotinamide N-methyase
MKLKEVLFNYGPVSLSVLAAADGEAFLDASLDSLDPRNPDADQIPYWAVLWESAFGLARWLIERGGWAGVPVLELGCGAGLAGLSVAALGALVTQTDLFVEAAALARCNARRNGLESPFQVSEDWRKWSLPGTWSVVVGSDVTYDRSVHAALLQTLARALAPEGAVYLADPGRPMTGDFLARAEKEGWQVRTEEAPRAPGEGPVFIYILQKRPIRLRFPCLPV